MKIEKAVTKDFESYQVLETVEQRQSYVFLFFFPRFRNIKVEQTVENVTEADDRTGLVVQQVKDKDGNDVYTNGDDDIAFDNAVKLLLLTTTIKQSFLGAGFRPKLTTRYAGNLKIIKIGMVEEKPVQQLQELNPDRVTL